MESDSCAAALTQVMYVRSLRDQCGARLRQVRSGDGGIPTVALQTSNVWANVVTAVVLFLSPDSALRRDDHGVDQLDDHGVDQLDDYGVDQLDDHGVDPLTTTGSTSWTTTTGSTS